MVPSRESDSAFMVKSRRSASRVQARRKTTAAGRPNASTAARQGGTSNGRPAAVAGRGAGAVPAGRAVERGAARRRRADGGEAGRLDPADHFGREHGGGDVDVAVRLADERIAHRAADDAGLFAVTVERGEKVAQRRLSQPCGIEAAPRLRHFVSPGTNWP